MNNINKLKYSLIASGLAFLPQLVWAQTQNPGDTTNPGNITNPGSGSQQSFKLWNPLGGSFLQVINKVIDAMYTIAIPICVIMALVGGFQILVAAGNPEKFKTGTKTLLFAAVGFGVIILAKGMVLILISIFQ